MDNLLLKNSFPAFLKDSNFFSSSSDVSVVEAAAGFKLIALTCSLIFSSSVSPTDSVSEIKTSLSLALAVASAYSKVISIRPFSFDLPGLTLIDHFQKWLRPSWFPLIQS